MLSEMEREMLGGVPGRTECWWHVREGNVEWSLFLWALAKARIGANKGARGSWARHYILDVMLWN